MLAWGLKPPTSFDVLGSIALSYGLERMKGEGWDMVGISQIEAPRFSNREH